MSQIGNYVVNIKCQCAGCLLNKPIIELIRIGKYYFCIECREYINEELKKPTIN